MRLKDIGFLYSGLSGKAGEDFQCDDLECTKPYIPFTNVLNNTKIDFNQFKRVVWTNGEIQNKVKENDIIFLMSSEDYESIAKAAVVVGNPGEVYLNSFCKGFRFKNLKSVCPEYVNYQLLTDKHRDALRFEARGFTRINIKMDRIESAAITLPPIDEQRKIVFYLDTKTAAIDKQIELLNDKKGKYADLRKSIIHQAVTQGLTGDTSEWIRKRFKDITAKLFLGQTPIYSEDENSLFIFGQRNNQTYGIDWNGIKYATTEFYASRRGYEFLQKGDVLLNSLGGGSVGRSGYFGLEQKGILTDGHIIVIRTNKTALGKYVYYYLQTKQQELEVMAIGSTNQCFLTIPDISIMELLLPPLSEQQAIASYLDEKCAKIDSLIANIDKQIEKYKLLRRALINEVVTGQRAV